jgi:hypothetical protein
MSFASTLRLKALGRLARRLLSQLGTHRRSPLLAAVAVEVARRRGRMDRFAQVSEADLLRGAVIFSTLNKAPSPVKRTRLVLSIGTAAGFGFLFAGYWEAVGRFSVTVGGQNYGCGSPFFGRWFQSGYDAADNLSIMCGHAAPTRRFLTYLFAAIGITMFVAVIAVAELIWYRGRLGFVASVASTSLNLLGIVAAVLLVVGGIFAEVHASESSIAVHAALDRVRAGPCLPGSRIQMMPTGSGSRMVPTLVPDVNSFS